MGKRKDIQERIWIEQGGWNGSDDFDIVEFTKKMDIYSKVHASKQGRILTLSVMNEFLMEEIILKYYLGGMRKEKKIHFRDSFLEKAHFPTKMDLLRRIFEDKDIYPGKYKKRIIGTLEAQNTMRNVFAHNMLATEHALPDGEIEYIELGKGLSRDNKNDLIYGSIIRYSIKDIEEKELEFLQLNLYLRFIFWNLSKPDPMDGYWPEQVKARMEEEEEKARKRAEKKAKRR